MDLNPKIYILASVHAHIVITEDKLNAAHIVITRDRLNCKLTSTSQRISLTVRAIGDLNKLKV